MRSRLALVVCLVVLAGAGRFLSAQSIGVGWDTPVAPAPSGEAFLGQSSPSVATDGKDFFVAWTDFRSGSYIADVFGSRVSREGIVLDQGNVGLATSSAGELFPAVAWDGSRYLIAYNEYATNENRSGVMAAEVSADGKVLARGEPLVPDANIYTPPVLSGGASGTLLGVNHSISEVAVVANLTWAGTTAVDHRISSIVPWHDGFLVLGPGRDGSVMGSLVNRWGDRVWTRTLLPGVEGSSVRYVGAASSGSIALVAVSRELSTSLLLVSGDDPVTSHVTDIDASSALVTVAWQGAEFVVSWADSYAGSEIRGLRVTSGGTLVDSAPFVLGHSAGLIVSIASAGSNGTVLVAWGDSAQNGDVWSYTNSAVRAVLVTDDTFASATPPAAFALSRSPAPQTSASIAPTGDGYFVAWQEADDSAASQFGRELKGPIIASYLDRTGHPIAGRQLLVDEGLAAPTEIATLSSPRGDLAVWRRGWSLAGALLGTDGVQTFLLDGASASSRPALCADGDGFLIAYGGPADFSSAQGTFLARVGADLALSGPPKTVAPGSAAPALVPDGDALLVATAVTYPSCQILCPAPPDPELRLSRLTRDGLLIRTEVLAAEYGEPAMACGSECLVAWWAPDGIAWRIAGKDLSSIGPRRVLPTTAATGAPSVTWDGRRFLVTWPEANGEALEVLAASVSTAGEMALPVVAATSRGRMFEWMLSPSPSPLISSNGDGGALLLYGHVDQLGEGGGVRRLFARTLREISRTRALRR